MEGERVCPTTMTDMFRPVRISWDQTRRRELLQVDASIPKEVRGNARAEALQATWLEANPTLPSRGTALMMQLSRMHTKPRDPPTSEVQKQSGECNKSNNRLDRSLIK